ncbi:histamine H2 receptor-like [Amphiura filiformis]|uniref:histamine H2 receptor-like n=1 Tax=Amphiura filiformis TaxID=82378 RepID=UPI003B21976F
MSTATPDISVIFTWTWTTYSQLIMALIGVVGNGLVISVYNQKRQSKSVTNELLVALAVADLMTSILIIPLPGLKTVPSDWRGQMYCKVVTSAVFMWTSITVSVFTLTAVSIERYLAILKPSTYPLVFSRGSRSKIAIYIWIVGAVLNSYSFFIWNSVDGACEIVWFKPWLSELVGVASFLLKYLIPVVIMLVTQIAITVKIYLERQKLLQCGVSKGNPAFSSLEVKAKVVAMLRVVVIMFILCWSADQTCFLGFLVGLVPLRIFFGTCLRYFSQLAFLNSIINPFIYAFTNPNFRDGLRQLLLCSTAKDSFKITSAADIGKATTLAISMESRNLSDEMTAGGNKQEGIRPSDTPLVRI